MDWDIVQDEVAARKRLGIAISAQSFMSCKLICEDCGGFNGAKVWHSTDQYRKIIYQCNHKYKGNKKCETPHITEEEIKELFLKAYNTYMKDRDRIIGDAREMCDQLSDTADLEVRLASHRAELDETSELYRLLITRDASNSGTSEFQLKEKQLYEEYIALSDKVSTLSGKIADINLRRNKLLSYISAMSEKPEIAIEWDNSLWVTMINRCIVHRDKTVTFIFRDGTEIIK